MKTIIAIAALIGTLSSASAQYGTGSNSSSHVIRPYTTQSGTNVGAAIPSGLLVARPAIFAR
jgi:hypothetical protein